jgi:hypothetical protein
MLVIRIERRPASRPESVELLGLATITNTGAGGRELGSYQVKLFRPSAEGWQRTVEQMIRFPLEKEVWRKGWVETFPRLRLGVWDLLLRALAATVDGKRNPPAPVGAVFGPPVGQVDDEVP